METRGGVDQGLLGVDSSSAGNAINCQSLVLKFERGDRRVLLTGDMQLADPRVAGLGSSMNALRQRIAQAGPYDMVKLPHHGAANGFNASVLDDTRAPLLTLSTGPGSSRHPHPLLLDLLRSRSQDVQWLRTDRNGRLKIDYSQGEGECTWQRGDVNDLTPNVDPDAAAGSAEAGSAAPSAATPPRPFARTAAAALAALPPIAPGEPLPAMSTVPGQDHIEVILRLPNKPTRVTFTIEIEPEAAATPPDPPEAQADEGPALPSIRIAAGRLLPRLVFASPAYRLGQGGRPGWPRRRAEGLA